MVDVSRVFLDQDNPRHEPFEDQDEVISYLCEFELVLPIAKDIAKNGLNPLELFALLPDGKDTYFAAEAIDDSAQLSFSMIQNWRPQIYVMNLLKPQTTGMKSQKFSL